MASPTYLPEADADAESQVTPPAVAIVVVAGLGIACAIFMLLVVLLGVSSAALGGMGRDERLAQLWGGTFWSVWCVATLILCGTAIVGALKMKSLQNYGLAVTSAVIMILPCWCCCLAGAPIGIWALVVLVRPGVRSAFRS